MRKKKLCLFITRLIAGGAQKIVISLLKDLDGDKYDLTLIIGITPEDEPNLIGQVPEDVSLIRLNNVVREISPLNDIKAFFTLYRIFRKEKFDIIHLHTSKAGVLGSFAAYLAGIKNIIYTPHGHIFHETAQIPGVSDLPPLKKKILYILRKTAYRCCGRLVALSEEDKQEQIELGLAAPDKFYVIMNGIDVELFSPGTEEENTGAGTECVVLGSVGRLSREKGHDVLIEAFSISLREYPDLRLILVGDGKESASLKSLVKKYDIAEKVVFHGNVDDVLPLLRDMDIFILPSRYESQGLAAMEAMSAGIPVIASNVGGVPGIITDNREGLLVEPENPSSLSNAILKLVNNKALREKLADNARARAEKDFSICKMISAYEKLYGRSKR